MAAASKKLPLTSSNNANVAGPGKTIEETYQKKSQLEHILLRPDTYIGSIEKHTQDLWVYENDVMVQRKVTYVPGLYKIFDEILVNAADNKQRDPRMDALRVTIDVEQNLISVYNNGDGVPVEIHQEEQIYVPELIFGHLLTSSNYDDSMKKTTGGRNGYGAKLTNIFSTEFVIETADGRRQRKYKQVFSNNMGKKLEPVITKCKESENWTKVSFKPDLSKFKMTHLEEDVVALMKKRVIDMAGCLGKTVKVELNGKRVPVKSFLDYVDLYLNSASDLSHPLPRIEETVNERWDICLSLSSGGQFQQVSFVNSIATIKGGTHVDYVTNQIVNHILAILKKKSKNPNLKPAWVKSHLWVFVNSLIDNPAFDSQTKENLTLNKSSFGSKCEISEKFLQRVAKSVIFEELLSWATLKQSKDLKKTDGKKGSKISGIPKLEDANDAGGKNSDKCTLILTEGDSAKALAMAGLSVVGRDHYGVFPLRGKLLNVREASLNQIKDNKEIQHIKQILGLKQNTAYESVHSLRYGHLMIMTDQDDDGSHIKGLLINFIHSFWPSLLKVPSFMVEFITPIVKVSNKRSGEVLSFFTQPEYETWKERFYDKKVWEYKYYKGLGTNTSKEGKEYFSNLDKHKKDFFWADEKDGDLIELAFSKKKIEARKNWLRDVDPATFLDQKEKLISYSDFINKELVRFSLADLKRSIPSMVDGLKPGQRKILFCAFKRNFVKEAKVAQFSGYVSEKSAYHHGEQSLAGSIIGMAQDFVGSNNINFLVPNGQFGTRNLGGKDHASPRYIFTSLSPITRFLFPKDDDNLLDYDSEDGQSIEPYWYMPIIPTVLVNGSEGIGTGWSSYIPNYNPRDIINNLRRLLNGEMMEPMHPWYRGFSGTIEKTATKETGVTYTVCGSIEEVDEKTLRITELPVRRWTQDYKEFLESMTGKDAFIEDVRNQSDDIKVDIEVILSENNMMVAKQEGLLKKFKLTNTISTSNMHLFDSKGMIKKYDTPEQILEEFFHLRLDYYEKRKKSMLQNLELELLKLDNKVRFILGVVRGEIVVSNRKRADLFVELKEKGFTPFPKKTTKADVIEAESDPEDAEVDSDSSGYDYLLSLAIGSLTYEKVQKLCSERDNMTDAVDLLKKSTPKDLWNKDLEALELQLEEQDKKDAEAAKKVVPKGKAGVKVSRPAPKAPRKTTKKAAVNVEPADISMQGTSTTTASVVSDTAVANAPAAKPKARAPRKAPAAKPKKNPVDDDDDDPYEIMDLKDRLAAHNLNASPENSAAMETETSEVPPKAKRGAASKKAAAVSLSDSEDEIEDDYDSMEVARPPPAGKKAGASSKAAAAKPPAGAAAKKRGPSSKAAAAGFGQKLVTEMLKPAGESSGVSPEKKVRRMRASPFNKKSSSVLGKTATAATSSNAEGSVDSGSEDENAAVVVAAAAAAPKPRPQRARRQISKYVLSDSEEEDEVTNISSDSDTIVEEDDDSESDDE